jgi:hypothetical protein
VTALQYISVLRRETSACRIISRLIPVSRTIRKLTSKGRNCTVLLFPERRRIYGCSASPLVGGIVLSGFASLTKYGPRPQTRGFNAFAPACLGADLLTLTTARSERGRPAMVYFQAPARRLVHGRNEELVKIWCRSDLQRHDQFGNYVSEIVSVPLSREAAPKGVPPVSHDRHF